MYFNFLKHSKFFGILFSAVLILTLYTCKKNKNKSQDEFHEYRYVIEYNASHRILNYAFLEGNDTLSAVNYWYKDSFVFILNRKTGGTFSRVCMHLKPDNYAWLSDDSNFYADGNLRTISRSLYFRDNDNYCRKQVYILGQFSDTVFSFGAPSEVYYDSLRNGNLEYTSVKVGSSYNCSQTNSFGQQVAINSFDLMYGQFFGMPNKNLLMGYSYMCTYKGSVRHSVNITNVLDGAGFVVEKTIVDHFSVPTGSGKKSGDPEPHTVTNKYTYQYILK